MGLRAGCPAGLRRDRSHEAQTHWQIDVLAGAAIGALSGYYSCSRDKSFTLQVLPNGFSVGWKKQF